MRWQQIPGGHGGGDTPVPIPNTAVKPARADGTWRSFSWESRSLPGFGEIEERGAPTFQGRAPPTSIPRETGTVDAGRTPKRVGTMAEAARRAGAATTTTKTTARGTRRAGEMRASGGGDDGARTGSAGARKGARYRSCRRFTRTALHRRADDGCAEGPATAGQGPTRRGPARAAPGQAAPAAPRRQAVSRQGQREAHVQEHRRPQPDPQRNPVPAPQVQVGRRSAGRQAVALRAAQGLVDPEAREEEGHPEDDRADAPQSHEAQRAPPPGPAHRSERRARTSGRPPQRAGDSRS